MKTVASSILIFAIFAIAVSASPLQLHGGENIIDTDKYVPVPVREYLIRYLQAHSKPEPTFMKDYDTRQYLRLARRGLDDLPNMAYSDVKKIINIPHPAIIGQKFEPLSKKNIDEIDRTAFDNFYKREFDEIDRGGFNQLGRGGR